MSAQKDHGGFSLDQILERSQYGIEKASAELAQLRAENAALREAVNEARIAMIDELNHGDVSDDYQCECTAHLWLAAHPAEVKA